MYTGAVVFSAGILLGLRVILHYISTGWVAPYLPTAVLSTLVTIIGFQIIIFGLLADMIRTNQNLHEEILYRVKKGNTIDKKVVNSNYVKIVDEFNKP